MGWKAAGKEKAPGRHGNALSGLHRFEVLPLGTQNCVKLIQLIVSFPVLQSLTKLFSLSGKPPVKC